MRLLAILVLLAACGDPTPAPPRTPRGAAQDAATGPKAPQPKLPPLPDFSFQEAQGRAIGSDDLRGKVWVAATVFTHCPTHCPAMCQAMYDLQQEFADEPDFRLLTVSVDPARDTQAVLKEYARSYYANPERWYFARHPERTVVRKFVVDGLKIPWDDAEPLNHSYRLVLVDRSLHVRGWYKRTEPGKMDELRKRIRELLAEKQPS